MTPRRKRTRAIAEWAAFVLGVAIGAAASGLVPRRDGVWRAVVAICVGVAVMELLALIARRMWPER